MFEFNTINGKKRFVVEDLDCLNELLSQLQKENDGNPNIFDPEVIIREKVISYVTKVKEAYCLMGAVCELSIEDFYNQNAAAIKSYEKQIIQYLVLYEQLSAKRQSIKRAIRHHEQTGDDAEMLSSVEKSMREAADQMDRLNTNAIACQLTNLFIENGTGVFEMPNLFKNQFSDNIARMKSSLE